MRGNLPPGVTDAMIEAQIGDGPCPMCLYLDAIATLEAAMTECGLSTTLIQDVVDQVDAYDPVFTDDVGSYCWDHDEASRPNED